MVYHPGVPLVSLSCIGGVLPGQPARLSPQPSFPASYSTCRELLEPSQTSKCRETGGCHFRLTCFEISLPLLFYAILVSTGKWKASFETRLHLSEISNGFLLSPPLPLAEAKGCQGLRLILRLVSSPPSFYVITLSCSASREKSTCLFSLAGTSLPHILLLFHLMST